MSNKKALPVVCTLSPETLATRKAGLVSDLARRATSRTETVEGIALQFPADALPAIAAVIDAERKCCRFLRFDVSIEPDEGPVTLTLSGPAGTAEFLAALLDA